MAQEATEQEESENVKGKDDDDEEREKRPKYEKRPSVEYDVEKLGWGANDQEIYNDYGVILNYVDN